jgi:outer membrane biosynthesis protein TonB
METHELWQLLDDMDSEREKSRRRESFYISTIVWMVIAWFLFYGPHVLWHQPHMINPADALKNRDLTYLDLPPDALKQIKPKTPPKILSDKDRVAQTPDKRTLQHLQAMEPPAPPAQPQTTPPQEQAGLPSAPQPQQQPQQPIVDAPRPQPTRPNSFNPPSQSAGENIRQLAENAVPTRPGLGGTFGSGNLPHHQGLQGAVEVLSDTSGVDPDELQRWLRRLYYQVYNNWLPLIPEEARPPLNKQGETQIRFVIQPNGIISAMYLDDSTHDDALNHAAWGSINSLGQLPPLPKGMKDPNLVLRYHYFYNPPNE